MRISGLATGMDTETIIRDMMNAHRIPLDKITQKKQYLEWQLDDYRTVNRNLFDFSQKTFDTMILSKTFNQKTVEVSAPNDVSIRNVSATNDFSGTLQVEQLAKNATLQGGVLKQNDVKLTTEQVNTAKLSDLGLATDGSFVTIEVQAPGEAEAKTLTFSSLDSIGAVLTQINKETGAQAFFDEHTGKIAMTAKKSGEGNLIIQGDLATALQIQTSAAGDSVAGGATTQAGQNAKFTFNGLQTERSSNTFQLNGFEVTLKAANKTDITFSSAPDTEKIFESVVKYVDDYNKLIEDLNKQIREPRYRSFQPLSDEQKKEMKEKEIELWEEKAKSGTLRNDSTISSMLTQMRTALTGSIEGLGSLKDIGITTSKNYLDHGKLVINEEELKAAISADPSKVHEMFSKEGETQVEQGFARRLRGIVDETQKSIAKRAGKVGDVNDTFTLGRTLKDMNNQISRFEERLKMTEDRYWKQFTAMERAIQRANAQSASLMNAFGGGM